MTDDDIARWTDAVEAEYDRDEGFLGRLRDRRWDPEGSERFLMLLRSIDLGEAATVDRRLVSLLWYVPLFMMWQDHSLKDDERDASQRAQDAVHAQLERILGVP